MSANDIAESFPWICKPAMTNIILQNLNFDVYQRFKGIFDVVSRLDISASTRLLDVGGYPGTLADLLSSHRVVTIDRPPCARKDYVIGSGADLPFPDNTFDVVISSDTLEHIPPTERNSFLRNLIRVSNGFIIIGAPFNFEHVRAAEHEMNELHKIVKSVDNPWLKEHLGYGLPELSDVIRLFEQENLKCVLIPNGDALLWSLAMNLQLLTNLIPGGTPLLGTLNTLVNEHWDAAVFPDGPAYRYIVVAFPPDKAPVLRMEQDIKDHVEGSVDLAAKIRATGEFARAFATQTRSVFDVSEERNIPMSAATYISQVELALRHQEGEIKNLREENKRLAARLKKIDENPILKFARTLFRR
jgi:hypothetical protein